MKKLLIIAITLLLLAVPQISLAFEVIVPDRTVSVPIASSVQIDVQIYSEIDDNFNINIVDTKSWISLSDTRLSVDAGKTETVTVTFSPYMDTTLGLYKIEFVAESLQTGKQNSGEIYISVVKEGVVEIEKIFVTGDLGPAGKVKVSIHAKSFKATTAQDIILSARINSPTKKIFSFYDIIERLDPDEIIAVEKYFYLEDYAEPGIYTVDAEVEYEKKVSRMTQSFSVVEKPVIKKEVRDFLILGTGKIIAVTNVGNKKSGKVIVNETVSDIDKIFFSGDPTEISGNIYTWEIAGLQPGETAEIEYKIDYIILFLLLIALLVIVWYIIFKVRTVVIKKNILQKQSIKEGSEFTVGIEIKNSTGGSIEDVVIRDFIPSAFRVKDAYCPKPVKKATHMGAELKWEIDTLARGEVRIMTYKIIPVFGVHGEVKLSSAIIRFKKGGTLFEARSGAASIGLAYPKEKQEK